MCAASLKKSLAGLDSTQTEGVNAVTYLEAITDFLRKNDENDDAVSISFCSLLKVFCERSLSRAHYGRENLRMLRLGESLEKSHLL